MLKFSDIPIKKKIMMIMFSGMSIAMGTALLFFILIDRYSSKKYLLEELTILARITAARSGAAVTFGDRSRALQNLEQLAVRESIVAACIYTEDHALFARYLRRADALPDLCKAYLEHDKLPGSKYLSVEEPLANRSKKLGRLVVVSDLSPVVERSFVWLSIFLLMSLIGLFVVVLMTRRMQTSIVSPIQHITGIMDEVRSTSDLTRRAYPAGKDELGDLVAAFNEMLELIERSNTDLEMVYGELVNKSTKAEATAVELEARNIQIKEMLSGAAHDLRQPLQAMSIFIDMLEIQVNTEKQKSLVEKTQLAMHNLQEMFKEILDVSRIEHSEGTADIQPVDVSSLLAKLQLEFGALAKKKNLELRIRVKSALVNTVPGILERIIRNLVSNALNYTDEGGVMLTARSRKGGMLIEVWDTGRGIPERKRDKIFQKYEQAGKANLERSGYGLGLAIVKKFIDLLGYSLTFKSIENKGSCFRVFIPNLLIENPSKDKKSLPEADLGTETDASEGNQENYLQVLESLLKTTVFLVDDDQYIREAVTLVLESWGMGVMQFSGMVDLVRYFEAGDFVDPDIIISDYQLGDGVTGDEAIDEIRTAVGIDVPAFIITGNPSPRIHQQIIEKGFDYLLKPVNSNELKEKITEFLGENVCY